MGLLGYLTGDEQGAASPEELGVTQGAETPSEAEGNNAGQANSGDTGVEQSASSNEGVSEVERRLEQVEERLREKDRYIGRLEQQVSELRDSGDEPEEDDGFGYDEQTLDQYGKAFEQDPARATVAMMEDLWQRIQERDQRYREKAQEEQNNEQLIRKAEENTLRQVRRAAQEIPGAKEIVREFLDPTTKPNSRLAQVIKNDPSITLSQTGVYNAVARLASEQSSTEETQPQSVNPAGRPGSGRPGTVEQPEEEVDFSEEAGDRIVNARGDRPDWLR